MPAWLKHFFPTVNKPIDNIGIWWAVFGPSGVLSVIFGWAASAFTPIAQYGWGAIIFAGVGAACVVMFAASALMIAWRYLIPLHPTPNDESTASTAGLLETRDSELQQIHARLDDLTTTVINL